MSLWVSKWRMVLTHSLSVKFLYEFLLTISDLYSFDQVLAFKFFKTSQYFDSYSMVICKCLFLITVPSIKYENWVLCYYILYSGSPTGECNNAEEINSANMTLLSCIHMYSSALTYFHCVTRSLLPPVNSFLFFCR